MRLSTNHIALLFALLFFSTCKTDGEMLPDTQSISSFQQFTLLAPSQTKVNFENILKEGLNTNVLMYEYFYNGGGVAAGDLNGDDLPDLYFTSNMGVNQIYLNKGGMQFEEISIASGASGRPGPWKTGVTFADVNGDGRQDIYLCYSGSMPEPKRANQLLINQGNNAAGIPTFKDEAATYGLDSKAFSNQGYFFDYDRDGDLDMLLLNHNPKSLPVLNEVTTAQEMAKDDSLRGLRLYRNDNRFFNDVTVDSKIIGSALSYGLGIGISDLNHDGWPDFYVSNDYTIPDYLYINNQDGTFTNRLSEQIRYSSHFSMGNDIADLNNDGFSDIITLDMLPEDNERQKLLMSPDNFTKFDLNVRSGFYYQYMRNMLQLNNGNGTFSEVGQLAGISNTDWSWAALAADYDNDGWKDLYVTNGYHRDYTNLDFINYMNAFVAQKGRLQREDVLEIINNMPASDVVNYMFSNKNLSFENTTKAWGLHHISNSNGAAYADLDNDGDLDLITNNINRPAFIFQNEANKNKGGNYLKIKLFGTDRNTRAIGARIIAFAKGKKISQEQYPTRGYLSSVSEVLHFGLGEINKIDSLIVYWPNGKQQKIENVSVNRTLDLEEKNTSLAKYKTNAPNPIFKKVSPSIKHKNTEPIGRDFDRQILLINELSHQGPCMTKGDLNGDGLEDVFIGGSKGQAAKIYLQQKNQSFREKTNAVFETDKLHEDSEIALFDANGDGYLDAYVTSGGYHDFKAVDPALQDRLYLNDGKANFRKSIDAIPVEQVSNATLAVHDFNGDGHSDIFVGGRLIPGRYPEIPTSSLLINDGKGNFTNEIESIAPELKNLGMITDAVWLDVSGNGQKDLIVVGEWLPISVFEARNGKLDDQSQRYFFTEYKGWWNTIEVADLNGDGKPDLIVGNAGTNLPFKVSEQEPGELFFKDFDNNGSVDPIFCTYVQGKSYPFVTRDELVKQLAPLRSKFNSYQSFANARMPDVFNQNQLADAKQLSITHLETSLFLSQPDGKFKQQPLPVQVQYSPVNAIQVSDFDKDGKLDILLCGNNRRTKIRIGNMEANYGVLLKGNDKGDFEYVDQTTSGLDLRGAVQDVIQIGDVLYFGINGEPLETYKINYKPQN